MDIRKILVPTDGSEDSEKALNAAKNMAEKFESQIILLNVIQLYNDYSNVSIQHCNILTDDIKSIQKISEELLEADKRKLKNLNVKTIFVIGHPADKIISIAADENVDLIIMATHGMGKVKRFLMGSVTNNVVHHSKIPVLVIP